MATAFTNKKFKRIEYKRNGMHINVYYGRASDGQTIQINISLYNPNDVVSIYPIKI